MDEVQGSLRYDCIVIVFLLCNFYLRNIFTELRNQMEKNHEKPMDRNLVEVLSLIASNIKKGKTNIHKFKAKMVTSFEDGHIDYCDFSMII